MRPIRFVMLGGFLGAGKTTALARLARHYTDAGRKVGIVTNDQAQDLVDTHSLRSQGFAVQEVPGACFCCKFNDLVGQMGKLSEGEQPDVILAEPVGSCTDLVATVVQPMRDLYRERFHVAPYAVLFKPSHGLRILRGEGGGFSPKAAYIFRKQLEEADAIVINRVDEMAPTQLDELAGLVAKEYPGTPVVRMSAKTGQGFEALVAFLDQDGAFGGKILDIDYDVYAEGEAELGWLNMSGRLSANASFDLDTFVLKVVGGLAADGLGEVAHLKVIGLSDASFAVANLVSSTTGAELSLASRAMVSGAELIVNARVAMDPTELEAKTRAVVTKLGGEMGVAVEFRDSQSLRPGRPTPTHRYAASKS